MTKFPDLLTSYSWTYFKIKQSPNYSCNVVFLYIAKGILKTALYIPSNVCHGAQCIKALGDGDSGDLIHSQDGCLLLGQQVHQLWILSWIDEAD